MKFVAIALTTFLVFGSPIQPMAQEKKPEKKKTTIYCISGQGADERLFSKLTIPEEYTLKHIQYTVPSEGITLAQYAKELSKQIDTTHDFIVLGVSLGGMIATEINDQLNPKQVIIISSAKCRNELPMRYRFQLNVPVYSWFSPSFIKRGAQIMQPLVEPDRDQEESVFVSMLEDKDSLFLKRTIDMIINWDRETYDDRIIHIHGDKDHTIPIRNVACTYTISGGSHMMMLTRGEELSKLIGQILIMAN